MSVYLIVGNQNKSISGLCLWPVFAQRPLSRTYYPNLSKPSGLQKTRYSWLEQAINSVASCLAANAIVKNLQRLLAWSSGKTKKKKFIRPIWQSHAFGLWNSFDLWTWRTWVISRESNIAQELAMLCMGSNFHYLEYFFIFFLSITLNTAHWDEVLLGFRLFINRIYC